jgi:hypothetical protein
MAWTSRSRVSGDAKPGGSRDETIINGAPYLGPEASRSDPKHSVAVSDYAAEEIKRRQVSLLVRYVTTMRAR